LSSSSSGAPDPGSSDTTNSGDVGGLEAGTAARLKAQMEADALRPLDSGSVGSDGDDDDERPLRMRTAVDPDGKDLASTVVVWPEETLLQVGGYLQLSAPQRLEQVLEYLRNTYYYCFWCGAQYASVEELAAECPGLTEEEHD